MSDKHGRLHPQLARTGAVLLHHPFGYNQKRNQENGYTLLFFFGVECLLLVRSRGEVGARVGVNIFRPESESESLKNRRLCSPGRVHRAIFGLAPSQGLPIPNSPRIWMWG